MERSAKHALVKSLNEEFNNSSVMVVAHYQGLTVAEITALRKSARANNVNFKVTKNTLARLAVKGTPFEVGNDYLSGPTAIAYSNDPVATAKIITEYAKTNDKLVVVGGVFNEQKIDVNTVKALATMPSLDELRAKIIGLLQAPATKVAGVLQAPAGQLARVINAYATK